MAAPSHKLELPTSRVRSGGLVDRFRIAQAVEIAIDDDESRSRHGWRKVRRWRAWRIEIDEPGLACGFELAAFMAQAVRRIGPQRTVGGETGEEIVEGDFRAVGIREAREAVAAVAPAGSAGDSDDDPREFGQVLDWHFQNIA